MKEKRPYIFKRPRSCTETRLEPAFYLANFRGDGFIL